MVYGDFKDFAKRTASDKVLHAKTFNIVKNPEYDEYQRGLASTVYECSDKKFSSGNGFAIKQNQQLVEELSKAITRKLKKNQVYSSLKDNIWGADLADMQLTSKFNKRIHFLLCY